LVTVGVALLIAGIVVMIAAGRVVAQQIRRAGADPSRGEFAYARDGGVSKRTSAVMLVAWALVVVGGVLTLVGLI
jgi:hypothetical protein